MKLCCLGSLDEEISRQQKTPNPDLGDRKHWDRKYISQMTRGGQNVNGNGDRGRNGMCDEYLHSLPCNGF